MQTMPILQILEYILVYIYIYSYINEYIQYTYKLICIFSYTNNLVKIYTTLKIAQLSLSVTVSMSISVHYSDPRNCL